MYTLTASVYVFSKMTHAPASHSFSMIKKLCKGRKNEIYRLK